MTDTKTSGPHQTWGPGMTESHIQYRQPCVSINTTICIRTQCVVVFITAYSKICSQML